MRFLKRHALLRPIEDEGEKRCLRTHLTQRLPTSLPLRYPQLLASDD